jgi:hypothetical protein
MKMFKTFDWVHTAELVSATTGKFLVGNSGGNMFYRSWETFLESLRGVYGETEEFYDLSNAVNNGELITFNTEEEARKFYSLFVLEGVFAYLVSPTEGYLTDTN